MKTMYEATWNYKVNAVKIERESESSVWIDGRRKSKQNSFFGSFDEAKSYLVSKAKDEVMFSKQRLNSAENNLKNEENLKQ
jgi:hypothetical protein